MPLAGLSSTVITVSYIQETFIFTRNKCHKTLARNIHIYVKFIYCFQQDGIIDLLTVEPNWLDKNAGSYRFTHNYVRVPYLWC